MDDFKKLMSFGSKVREEQEQTPETPEQVAQDVGNDVQAQEPTPEPEPTPEEPSTPEDAAQSIGNDVQEEKKEPVAPPPADNRVEVDPRVFHFEKERNAENFVKRFTADWYSSLPARKLIIQTNATTNAGGIKKQDGARSISDPTNCISNNYSLFNEATTAILGEGVSPNLRNFTPEEYRRAEVRFAQLLNALKTYNRNSTSAHRRKALEAALDFTFAIARAASAPKDEQPPAPVESKPEEPVPTMGSLFDEPQKESEDSAQEVGNEVDEEEPVAQEDITREVQLFGDERKRYEELKRKKDIENGIIAPPQEPDEDAAQAIGNDVQEDKATDEKYEAEKARFESSYQKWRDEISSKVSRKTLNSLDTLYSKILSPASWEEYANATSQLGAAMSTIDYKQGIESSSEAQHSLSEMYGLKAAGLESPYAPHDDLGVDLSEVFPEPEPETPEDAAQAVGQEVQAEPEPPKKTRKRTPKTEPEPTPEPEEEKTPLSLKADTIADVFPEKYGAVQDIVNKYKNAIKNGKSQEEALEEYDPKLRDMMGDVFSQFQKRTAYGYREPESKVVTIETPVEDVMRDKDFEKVFKTIVPKEYQKDEFVKENVAKYLLYKRYADLNYRLRALARVFNVHIPHDPYEIDREAPGHPGGHIPDSPEDMCYNIANMLARKTEHAVNFHEALKNVSYTPKSIDSYVRRFYRLRDKDPRHLSEEAHRQIMELVNEVKKKYKKDGLERFARALGYTPEEKNPTAAGLVRLIEHYLTQTGNFRFKVHEREF